MFKTVHHSPVIYIFLKDQSLDCYNKFSVSGGSISDTPWYLERGEQKKKTQAVILLERFPPRRKGTRCSEAHFSQGCKRFGACQLPR